MIKSNFKKIVLGVTFVATSLMANSMDYESDTKSLVGIEAGGSSIDSTYGSANSPQTTTVSNLGIKIGAENRDFRAFVDAKYFYDSSKAYNYIVTYGGALQYKFNATKIVGFFIGVNGGLANISFSPSDGSQYRTLSSPYFGGDLGANIHITKAMDIELGGRVMSIQDTNTISGSEYRIGNIVTGYASIIFKWQMD